MLSGQTLISKLKHEKPSQLIGKQEKTAYLKLHNRNSCYWSALSFRKGKEYINIEKTLWHI